MDGLIFAGVIVVSIVAALYGSHQGATTIGEGFGSLFAGWRSDPWPRGVQEEDRDRPWGERAGSATAAAAPANELSELLEPLADCGNAVQTRQVTAARTRIRH